MSVPRWLVCGSSDDPSGECVLLEVLEPCRALGDVFDGGADGDDGVRGPLALVHDHVREVVGE